MPAISGPWPRTPTIVAEALLAVTDPMVLWLRPGPPADPAAVAAAIARSAAPCPAPDLPPGWLRPEQRTAFATLLTIVRRHRGAMLADATGTGKTFVALAVAGALGQGGAVALVPATLRQQWLRRAAELAIPLSVLSHEEVSRGRLPDDRTRFVIVDESHRFRNPHTRRYQHLAPWMRGRTALLLTATPIVNAPRDLAHQLLLGIRDDALAPAGVGSLSALLRKGRGHPSLGELVVAREPPAGTIPPRRHTTITWAPPGDAPTWVGAIESLGLSRDRGIAEVIRGVFWAAAGSSLAALRGAIRRYALLLDHAADARAVGRPLGRTELRAFTGPLGEQLALWELLASAGEEPDLELTDRARVPALLSLIEADLSRADPKLDTLKALLADHRATLVFTTSVDTVRYLRRHLANAAWCTGERAGIGHLHAPRDVVLGTFGPGAGIGPQVLIATDIAAEGLDLQRAERVVHFDLPWTPMRLHQREGRAARLGSAHQGVEVAWFQPPPWLAERERRVAHLRRKARVPAALGFSRRASELWRWRHEIGAGISTTPFFGACAAVAGARAGLLISLELLSQGESIGSVLGVAGENGEWVDDPGAISEAVEASAKGTEVAVSPDEWQRWMTLAAPHVQRILRLGHESRWSPIERRPEERALVTRLRSAGAEAARRRDPRRLALLERGLHFAARGHTAGELDLVRELTHASERMLWIVLERLVEEPEGPASITLRVAGMVLFVSAS